MKNPAHYKLRKQIAPRVMQSKCSSAEDEVEYLGRLFSARLKAEKGEEGYELIEEETQLVGKPTHLIHELGEDMSKVWKSCWIVIVDGKEF